MRKRAVKKIAKPTVDHAAQAVPFAGHAGMLTLELCPFGMQSVMDNGGNASDAAYFEQHRLMTRASMQSITEFCADLSVPGSVWLGEVEVAWIAKDGAIEGPSGINPNQRYGR